MRWTHLGTQCETELNPCVSNPCFYGECIGLTPFIWSCNCKPGWTGVDCQDSINECLSNPCLNAGNCTDGLNGYQCDCSPGFTGANCQTEINPCSSLPCQNDGKIVFECPAASSAVSTSPQAPVSIKWDRIRVCVRSVGRDTCVR